MVSSVGPERHPSGIGARHIAGAQGCGFAQPDVLGPQVSAPPPPNEKTPVCAR